MSNLDLLVAYAVQDNVSHCPFLALGCTWALAQQAEAPSSQAVQVSLGQRLGLPQVSQLDCTCSELFSLPRQSWALRGNPGLDWVGLIRLVLG